MDRQIKDLMEQGLTRNEIFEQLRKQAGNQMRLAQKIATFEPCSPAKLTVLLNRVLMALCLLQAFFGTWVIYFNAAYWGQVLLFDLERKEFSPPVTDKEPRNGQTTSPGI